MESNMVLTKIDFDYDYATFKYEDVSVTVYNCFIVHHKNKTVYKLKYPLAFIKDKILFDINNNCLGLVIGFVAFRFQHNHHLDVDHFHEMITINFAYSRSDSCFLLVESVY